MADTNVETIREVEKTVIIPEHNEYPVARIPILSGSIIAAGDKVRVQLRVVDKDGVERQETQTVIMKIKDLPVDSNMEVIGAVKLSLMESLKPV